MSIAVTHGIKVVAKPRFEPRHSDAKAGHNVFSYRITIVNDSVHTVQLLRRHWFIFDPLMAPNEVEGPGVVGETPVIAPGERYVYTSSCVLRGSIGRMHGNYLMMRTTDDLLFQVAIPEFVMETPWSLN